MVKVGNKKNINSNNNWRLNSWRSFPIKQQPNYISKQELEAVEEKLRNSPSLVYPKEVDKLKLMLSKVERGEAFLLQGGDCAESFAEFSEANLKQYFKVMLQMTVALMYGAGKPVVKVGRIAGQFAKPRSEDLEYKDDKSLPSYRGDMVNFIDFDEKSRIPDPDNLVKAYLQSSATLNFLRSLAVGGYAELSKISKWNVDFINNTSQKRKFEEIVERVNSAIEFINACGLSMADVSEFNEAEFFTSHEGLLLNYEESLTRLDNNSQSYYCCSAHMLWIGDRTRQLDEAHIEFFRGVANPIGVKVGPSMNKDGLIELCNKLNPENESGKLVLISRMGEAKVQELLPPLVQKVKEEGLNVIWSCDPMHGNTIKAPSGYKTRSFNAILSEIRQFFTIHKALGTYAGGVHFEMTGQDVTECLGGAQAISEINLKDRYHTHCDPRLNASQSLELAFLIAEELKG